MKRVAGIALYLSLILLTCCMSSASAAGGSDVRVVVDEVKDTRTTGEFFAGLEVELKALGDDLLDVYSLRPVVTKAVDDTGRDLVSEDTKKTEFAKVDRPDAGHAKIRLKLKNPARRASAVRELKGELELFVPGRDPGAVAVIPDFLSQTGKKLTNPSLKSARVDIAIVTKAEYEEIAKKEKEEKGAGMAKELGDAMVKAFSALFGSFMEVGENSIILSVKDEGKKVIAIEFLDSKGEKIEGQGTMTMGDIKVFQFGIPMPKDARVKIFLATEQSLVRVPFTVKDIALP